MNQGYCHKKIPIGSYHEVFGREVPSPYMSMAPRVLEHIQKRYPALAHLDGTARHQSVGKADEPWIHALLLAVGRRIGVAALINTSFNTSLGARFRVMLKTVAVRKPFVGTTSY